MKQGPAGGSAPNPKYPTVVWSYHYPVTIALEYNCA
jgi:hypothetical protein